MPDGRRILRVLLPLSAVAGLVQPVGGLQTPPSHPSGPDGAAWAVLEAQLEEMIEGSAVPGAAVAVVYDPDRVRTAGFGQADRATGAPVTPGTLFRANSVSKSLVALAVLRLREEGRIDLDRQLRDVAPEIAFTNPWESSHPLRVAHLLEHTSGFDELHLREYAFGVEDGSLRDALALNPSPRTSRWPPGRFMAYNNGAYAVAAYLVERESGMPFSAFVEREILLPLGMDSSGLGLERVDRARLSAMYIGEGAAEPVEPYPLLIRPAGAFITSAEDLARLVQSMLRRGAPLIPPDAVERMEHPQTSAAARAGLRVGYGLGSHTAFGEGFIWHGHAGGTPAAYARYAYEPELGVGYVLLLNGNDSHLRRRMESAIQRHLVDGREPPMPTSPPAPALEEPAVYRGVYRHHTSSWQILGFLEGLLDVQHVRSRQGNPEALEISALLGDAPRVLVPAGGDLFRAPTAVEPDVVFLRDEDGRVDSFSTWDSDNLRAGNYRRISPLRAYGGLGVLLLSLLMIVTAPVVALLGALIRSVRRPPRQRARLVHGLPLAAALAFLLAVGVVAVSLSTSDITRVLGAPTPTAVSFWLLMLCFAILAPVGLVVAIHAMIRRRPTSTTGRLHALVLAAACTTVALYLTYHGIVGLRTWAF